jgi:hypothetical protein
VLANGGCSPALGTSSGTPREWSGLAPAAGARAVRPRQQKVDHAEGDPRVPHSHVRQLPWTRHQAGLRGPCAGSTTRTQIDLRSAALRSDRLGKPSDETPRRDGNSHGLGHSKRHNINKARWVFGTDCEADGKARPTRSGKAPNNRHTPKHPQTEFMRPIERDTRKRSPM